MAVLVYTLDVRNSTIAAPADNRATGLTPTWVFLEKADKTDVASPATAAAVDEWFAGSGAYRVRYDPAVNGGDAVGQLDFGGTLTNPDDRYQTIQLSQDGSLISSMVASGDVVATGTVVASTSTTVTVAPTGSTVFGSSPLLFANGDVQRYLEAVAGAVFADAIFAITGYTPPVSPSLNATFTLKSVTSPVIPVGSSVAIS